jgi:hypothetical protein
MHMYRLALGITIGLTLTVATGFADDNPKEKKIRSEFACSSVPSTFDNNGDGIQASANQCIGKGSGGPFTSQDLSELLAPLAAPVTCPQGTTEIPYELTLGVVTNSNTFDQLMTCGGQPGTLCLNPDSTFTFDLEYFICRGTGKLDGAQGSIHSKGTGQILGCDPAGLCISNYSGTSEGTLILP